MYLFGRSRTIIPGKGPAAVAAAIELCNSLRRLSGNPSTALYTTILSPQAETLAFTFRVENLAEMETVNAKVTTDEDVQNQMEVFNMLMTGPVTDRLTYVIYGTAAPEPPPVLNVVSTAAAEGHLREAVGAAIELAQAAERLFERPILLGASPTGPYGTMSWIGGADDLADLEQVWDKQYTDPGFLELVDNSGAHFEPGSTQTVVLRRLA